MSSIYVDYVTSHPYAAAARVVCYHSVASLTWLVWHFLVTLEDEVQYIWTMRNRNPFKWTYFFLRYVVILAHVMHNFLIGRLADGSNPPTLCAMWHAYVPVSSQILATLLELILASRVFALYNRSRRVAFLLLALILAEAAGTISRLSLRPTTTYHGTCLLLQLTKGTEYQSLLGLTVHCTLIGLTWVKYFFALRAGWGRTPLVSLVVRDGSTVYAIIIFLVVSVGIMYGLCEEQGIVLIFWSTSLISVLGCYMILSMERLARKIVSTESPAGQPLFTSKFDIVTLDSGRALRDYPHDYNIAPPLK